jgi:hypothetical protein
MTTVARRALLRFARPSPQFYKVNLFPKQRLLSTSFPRRQAVEENAPSEEVESLKDAPIFIDDDATQIDWSRSFHGLSLQPFSEETAKVLTAPIEINDVEIKPGSSSPHLVIDKKME